MFIDSQFSDNSFIYLDSDFCTPLKLVIHISGKIRQVKLLNKKNYRQNVCRFSIQ